MPQLPSGRHVGILCLTPDDIIKKFSHSHPDASLLTLGMKVKEIDSIKALKPYITVMFFQHSDTTNNQPLDSRSQAIPDGLESYDSGYTLDQQEQFTADWSREDMQAFDEFLKSEKSANYFQDVLNLIVRIGTQYQENLFGLMEKVCGGLDDADNIVPEWDDYDLLLSLCIFADIAKPEKTRQLDLWYRMNAIRRYWYEWIPELVNINLNTKKSLQIIADGLRDKSALNSCPEDKREWLHKQNVVFANNLFDFYDPDVLLGISREAYLIVKSVALSEPTR